MAGEDDWLPPELIARRARYDAILYPSNVPDEVWPGLFVGPMKARHHIERLGIGLVLSFLTDSTRDGMNGYRMIHPAVEHNYPIEDVETQELTLEMLTDVVIKIHTALCKQQRVLIHCVAGISRSAAIVIAYFLAAGIAPTVTAAVERLQEKRPCCQPNARFLRDLESHRETLAKTLTKMSI